MEIVTYLLTNLDPLIFVTSGLIEIPNFVAAPIQATNRGGADAWEFSL